MHVSVVTVTFNSADVIVECLESILQQDCPDLEVTVVDNASSDATRELLERYDRRVRLLINDRNRGFGAACNQGARMTTGTHLYFLNPDASLLQASVITVLAQRMAVEPDCGLCGTGLAGAEEPPMERHYPGQRWLRHPLPELPGDIAWVLGASMFVRREAFDAVGGFDERIFLYAEDADLCLRLRKRGYRIGVVPEVRIRHIGGHSERSSTPYESWRLRFSGLGQFYRNHYHAEDIRRLWRRDLLRARWRLTWHRIVREPGGRPGRLPKYSALRDVAREELRRFGNCAADC